MKCNRKNMHQIHDFVIGGSGSKPEYVEYWFNHLFVSNLG